jgi:CRP-like cAMP-binding protein
MYTLHEIPLFSGLNRRSVSTLQSQMLIHHYTQHSILFYEGDQRPYIHILLEGTVRLYKSSPKGKEIHMHYFEAPEIVDLFVAFEKIPFPASCEFMSEGTIGLIPIESIYHALEEVKFSLALITTLSRHIKMLSHTLHKEMIYSSDAKVADFILHNLTIFNQLKNHEVSSILNITPETLSRVLRRFKKEEMIRISAHRLEILKPLALEAIVETNHINH